MTGARNVGTLYPMNRGLSLAVNLDPEDITLKVYQTTVEMTIAAETPTITLPPVVESWGLHVSVGVVITNGGSATLQDQDDSKEWSNFTLDATNEYVLLFSDGRRWIDVSAAGQS